MNISGILNRKGDGVITISANANLKAAATIMHDRRIGALVVLSNRKVVGVISEGDIVAALAQHGQSAGTVWVRDVLSRQVSVTTDTTIERAMSLMTHGHLRHLPVINNGELRGIVSLGDIVKCRLEELEMESYVPRDSVVAAR